PDGGAAAGGNGDQAALEDGEAEQAELSELAFAVSADFSAQLAAFGGMPDLEAEQLAAALMLHKVPA
ncbi:hypothetical protein, partial [Thalassospira profundimaris]